jgi:hypothetical protein
VAFLIPMRASHRDGRRDPLSTRLYELTFELTEDPWFLGDPEPGVDSGPFRRGERVEPAVELRLPVTEPGRALDVTLSGGYIVVVTERIGSLIEGLAPNDVQRIPARVDSIDERYELLHVLARIDCIDWEHTRAKARVQGNLRAERGTLASLAPLIERDKLYRHVMSRDMTLKTEGIEGPRIFRVIDWELFPIITEEIKTALEQKGATGLECRPVLTFP